MGEIYLKRKIDEYQAAWKSDRKRKPMIVKEYLHRIDNNSGQIGSEKA